MVKEISEQGIGLERQAHPGCQSSGAYTFNLERYQREA
jgi:hypothetical protein